MFIYSNVCFGSRLFFFCTNVPCDGFNVCEDCTDFNISWDADRGKRWWTFLTVFWITQAEWFTSGPCLVTEWATGPQIGSPEGAGMFRIIVWAWGGFYLSIRWYWGWTLKSDKLLKIADMHSFLFGRSWHIWLWSRHKGSSAEALLNLPSQLIAVPPPPYPLPSREERRWSLFFSPFWGGGFAPHRCDVCRCFTLSLPLRSSQLVSSGF